MVWRVGLCKMITLVTLEWAENLPAANNVTSALSIGRTEDVEKKGRQVGEHSWGS